MKKLAITYYVNLITGCSDIVIHESGKKAAEYYFENRTKYFKFPIVDKTKIKRIPSGGMLRTGYPMRYYIARFLNDEEVKVYKKYNDNCCFNKIEQAIVAPIEEFIEV